MFCQGELTATRSANRSADFLNAMPIVSEVSGRSVGPVARLIVGMPTKYFQTLLHRQPVLNTDHSGNRRGLRKSGIELDFRFMLAVLPSHRDRRMPQSGAGAAAPLSIDPEIGRHAATLAERLIMFFVLERPETTPAVGPVEGRNADCSSSGSRVERFKH